MIRTKRVYEPSEAGDGTRFLVDRFWPRGMKKESLQMEAWLRDVAPSDSICRWFGHDPAKWTEFQDRYFAELDTRREALRAIIEATGRGNVTLLYSAHDTEHNNAIALMKYIEDRVV
ncbi:MAG: DUF488 family protein [Syntrophobacteraceae bacterium]|jgi:uncharacterized protein YeaO (DUF488 family)